MTANHARYLGTKGGLIFFTEEISMGYEDTLTATIYFITVIGIVLGSYVTYKIYSKEGFR